jgi:hypothetical protein
MRTAFIRLREPPVERVWYKVKYQDFGVTEKSIIGPNNKNRTSSPSDISVIEEGERLPAPLNIRLGNSSVSEQ